MQGYQKTTEERAFEKKVEAYLISRKVFFSKNFSQEITPLSRPDFFICIHGRFVALEIENYTKNEDGSVPQIQQNIIDSIKNSKGGFLTVSPDTFEEFKKSFDFALYALHTTKSFDDKLASSINKPKTNPHNQKKVIVEVKKKPFSQRNISNRNNLFNMHVETKNR